VDGGEKGAEQSKESGVWFVLQNDKRFTLAVDLLSDITARARREEEEVESRRKGIKVKEEQQARVIGMHSRQSNKGPNADSVEQAGETLKPVRQ